MSLPRADEWLGTLSLPPLAEVETCHLGPEDALITCAGFEDRAFEFLRRAVGAGSRGFAVVAVDYLPEVRENRRQELETLVSKGAAQLSWLRYDRENPADPTEYLLKNLPGKQLLIETSGMSRLLIVQFVCGLLRAAQVDRTRLLYAEAEQYPPRKEEVEPSLERADELFGAINFISSGVFEIIVPAELSTVSMYGQPIRLVAFPSFNPAQFAALRAEINASAFTVVNGRPPDEQNAWRTEAIRRLNQIASLREVEEATTSTLDYRETVKLLVDVYARHGDREKLVVAPIGSKMQAVAVGIVAGCLTDLQIVYPAPRSFPFPENYTRGIKKLYQLGLEFLSGGRRPSEMPGDTNGNLGIAART